MLRPHPRALSWGGGSLLPSSYADVRAVLMTSPHSVLLRPSTSYFIWMNEQRASVKEANPYMSTTDFAKHMGALWKRMDETEKRPVVELEPPLGNRESALEDTAGVNTLTPSVFSLGAAPCCGTF